MSAGAVQNFQTFVDALMCKYRNSENLELDPDIFIPKQAPGKADSSGNIVLNTEVLALHDAGISTAGAVEDIQDCLKCLRELDLTCNNVSEWDEVFKLLGVMPVLEFLNVTSNPLCNPVPRHLLSCRFPAVRHLVLNSTLTPWSALTELMKCFPNVEELHLSLNNYSSVDLDGSSQASSVCVLYFNGNNVANWCEVAKLGYYCPNLKSLVMCEAQNLQSLGDADQCRDAFPNLTSLTVSDTAIEDWEQIDTLMQFPALEQVKLQRIPLLEDYTEKEGRQLLVARLPTVRKLNGSVITDMEREDAERAFIRHYMDFDEKPTRYFELESRYGKLDPLVKLDLKPKTTAEVKLKFGDLEETRKISLRQTVKQFKKSLEEFAAHPVSNFRLFYLDHTSAYGAEELRFPARNLYALNIRDGSDFIIILKHK